MELEMDMVKSLLAVNLPCARPLLLLEQPLQTLPDIIGQVHPRNRNNITIRNLFIHNLPEHHQCSNIINNLHRNNNIIIQVSSASAPTGGILTFGITQ